MKLIKDGKIFDLSTATLIATSQPFMNYGVCQYKFYKSVNGTFFETKSCNSSMAQYNHPEEIEKVLTFEKARYKFEYISSGKVYGGNNYSFGYTVHVKYTDLFELTEG